MNLDIELDNEGKPRARQLPKKNKQSPYDSLNLKRRQSQAPVQNKTTLTNFKPKLNALTEKFRVSCLNLCLFEL